MVLATAAVSVMAIIDTLRTGRDKHAASDTIRYSNTILAMQRELERRDSRSSCTAMR